MNISENLGFAPMNRQSLDRNDRHRVGGWQLAVGGWQLAVGPRSSALVARYSGLPVGFFAFAVRGEPKGFDGVVPIGVASAFDRIYDRA
jgi:hypothetical protein